MLRDTPIGSIPLDWHITKLGDVAILQGGYAFKSSDFVQNGIPIVRMSNLKNGALVLDNAVQVSKSVAQTCMEWQLEKGDLLVGMSGSLGNFATVKESDLPALLNQRVGRFIVTDPEKCTYKFLKTIVLSNYYSRHIQNLAAGAAQLNISSKQIEETLFPLPPLDEQMRIADILDTVDAAIQQTGQLIAKLKQVKAGLLHDLLTRGLDEHGNLRDPEVHPEQFKVVDGYGRVPKDWEFVQIKDIAVQVTDGDHHTPQRSESGILLLSARNVLNGVLDLTDVDYVPKSEYLRMIKRCHPEAGDILISCSGTVGRVCAVPEGLRFALVRSVALIKFYDSRINSRYAEWVLRSNIVQSQIIASQRQAAQPNLFQGPIKDLFLPLPSILEQQTIVEILDGNESRIRAEEAYRDKLQAIKQGLMHDLLTGKVRV